MEELLIINWAITHYIFPFAVNIVKCLFVFKLKRWNMNIWPGSSEFIGHNSFDAKNNIFDLLCLELKLSFYQPRPNLERNLSKWDGWNVLHPTIQKICHDRQSWKFFSWCCNLSTKQRNNLCISWMIYAHSASFHALAV